PRLGGRLMSPRVSAWLVGVTLAVVVPGAALACAGMSPFAAPRLVVVHLLASLPLAIGLGLCLAPVKPQAARKAAVIFAPVGLALAMITFVVGPTIGWALDRSGAGFVERLVVRVVSVLVL